MVQELPMNLKMEELREYVALLLLIRGWLKDWNINNDSGIGEPQCSEGFDPGAWFNNELSCTNPCESC